MEALTAHNDAIERRMSVLSLSEQQQLQALLTKLRAGLQENLDEVEPEVAAALHR
jgi:hypothetical protein